MIVKKRRYGPTPIALLGLSAALLVWATSGAALAQDKPAAGSKDAKAAKPSKEKKEAAKAKQTNSKKVKRILQLPKAIRPNGNRSRVLPKRPTKRLTRPKRRVSTPKPTVKLKPGEVPNIRFDTPTYNFGRVRGGTPIVHDFWFTNTGNGPLEILRVKPS